MTTQTERLRAALERQGFKPVETKSLRTCVAGPSGSGRPVYLFLDKTGGARWNWDPLVGPAIPVSARSLTLLINGEPSKFFGPAKKEPTT